MKTIQLIDPPSGWKYGFPKVLPQDYTGSVPEWLVKNDYPQEEIDCLGKYFYYRIINQEIP